MKHSNSFRPCWDEGCFFLYQKTKKEEEQMLGMSDLWITAAWLLTIAGMVVCVIVGAVCWNKGDDLP